MGHGTYVIDVMMLLSMFDFVICEMTSAGKLILHRFRSVVYFVRIFPGRKRKQARNCRKQRYSHFVNNNYSGLIKTTVHFDTTANSLNFALRNIVNSITDRLVISGWHG